MNPYLTPELRDWRHTVRSFVESELVPISDAVERSARVPADVVERMRRLGLFGAHTKSEYGGLGMSMLGSCIAIEELAAAHIAFYYTCGVNLHIGSKAIEIAGTEAQKAKYLVPLATGELIGSLAMTEPDAGSDVSAISTSARLRGDRYVLNGRKIFITNAQIADCFTVIARTDAADRRGGLSAFIVPRGTEGISIGPPMEMLGGAGSFHNEVILSDCAVPEDHLLGSEGQGFSLAMQCLDHGRIHWAAYSAGLARTLLRHALERVCSRQQFGRAIGDNQAVQWKMADLASEVYGAQLIAYDAAWKFDHVPSQRTLYAAMAKLRNADVVFRVADEVLQLFGGYGYSKSHPIERMWRESRVVRILDGTSEMMRQIVGKEVMKNRFPI